MHAELASMEACWALTWLPARSEALWKGPIAVMTGCWPLEEHSDWRPGRQPSYMHCRHRHMSGIVTARTNLACPTRPLLATHVIGHKTLSGRLLGIRTLGEVSNQASSQEAIEGLSTAGTSILIEPSNMSSTAIIFSQEAHLM